MNSYNLLAEGRVDNNLTKLKEDKILDKAALTETRKFLKGTLRKHFLVAATGMVTFGTIAVISYNTALNSYLNSSGPALLGSFFAAVATLATPLIAIGTYYDSHFRPAYKAIHADLAKEQQRQIKEHSEKAPSEANAIGTAVPKKTVSFLGRSRVKPSA